MEERPTPDPPHPGKSRPPASALVPLPQRAKPARKRARCGVGDGSPRQYPPHPQPVVSGPRPHATRIGGRVWVSAQPRMPHTEARGAAPPAPSCCPHSAQSQLARARCGVGDGSPRQNPPHPQAVGSGPRPHAPGPGGRAWESAQPRTPHSQARGAPSPERPCPAQCAKPARKGRPARRGASARKPDKGTKGPGHPP